MGVALIKSFKHKGLEIFFHTGSKKGIQSKHADKISDILDLIDAAAVVGDVNFPGADLHPLKPKKDNVWAVRVSGAWRITFKFEDGDAYILDYLNYH